MTWEDDSLNSMIEGVYAHIPFAGTAATTVISTHWQVVKTTDRPL